jgi:hypothetical protein
MSQNCCSKCNKEFASKQSLKIHVQTSDCLKQKEKITKNCEFCSKVFSSKQMLQYHYSSCTDKKLAHLSSEYNTKIDKLTKDMELLVKKNETLHKAIDTNLINLSELCKVCNRYCINNKNINVRFENKADCSGNRTSDIFSSNDSVYSTDIEDLKV